MKRKLILIAFATLLITSIALALYPTVSSIINSEIAKSTINQYNNLVDSLDNEEIDKYLSQAEKYNQNLSNIVSDSFSPDAYNVDPEYKDILDFANDGMIGNISIPKIDCHLPIYHGIDESFLEKGAVHMCNTSLPIGGKSTHGVISAHTALPGKIFFDKLDKLEVGDKFYVSVLGKTLLYKVKDINIVLPTDTTLLKIVENEDLITLVTCTPYSINTHRLLVTGERDENYKDDTDIQSEENATHNYYIYSGFIVTLGIFVSLFFIIKRRKHNNDKKNKQEN